MRFSDGPELSFENSSSISNSAYYLCAKKNLQKLKKIPVQLSNFITKLLVDSENSFMSIT